MSKITLDNLSDNLKEYLNGLGLTSEQVNELINNVNGDLNDLYTTNKSSLVGAINELFQNANNGKELIASAIGEPLNSEDTFSAMSNDINGLLSTFKTNMMNNGITVESGDKFKALIDKIATMVEEGSNKGIQYASGNGTISSLPYDSSNYETYVINTNLDFTPTVLFWTVESLDYKGEYGTKTDWKLYETANSLINVSGSTCLSCSLSDAAYDCNFYLSNINSESFTLNYEINLVSYSGAWTKNVVYHWYAIGVGEEDTTLRDSLADILENKGVDVTEEDDMADLITKVDSIKSGGLDIISATELPVTGNNMQLCAITDNVTDSFILSNEEADVINSGDNTIGLHLSDLTMYEKYSYPMGGLAINLRIASTYQNASAIPLWLYYNNAWKQICFNNLFIVKDKVLQDGFTISTTNRNGTYSSSKGIGILPESTANLIGYTPFKESIDFSKYRAVHIKGTYKNTSNSTGTYGPAIGIFGVTSNLSGGTQLGTGYGISGMQTVFNAKFSRTEVFESNNTTTTSFDITFDVSSITAQYYLGIATAMTEYTYITDIELIMN